ncbi:MAG: hypothetical protein K5764_01595 [Prevotella sp.]|nr:hypothetical protein [Prevotella sp.]
MYDKIKLWIDRADVGVQYSNIAAYLDEAKEQTDLKTGEIRTFGTLQGLKVNLYVGGLSVIGSLPKFYYGNNITPLDLQTTQQALGKIADTLHLSLDEAKVTGLEFGANFVLRCKVSDYLDRLGDMPRLQRYRFSPSTLYYRHKGQLQPKTFCYYDKIADAKAKQMDIPQGFQDAKLLRAEMRLEGRLPYQLGVPEVTASTLTKKDFYRQLMKRFQDAYFSIPKRNKLKAEYMGQIKSVSDAFDVFVGLLIDQTAQSQDKVTAFLDELKEADVFKDRINYTRLKQRIERAANKAHLTCTDELIRELDDEFKNCGAYV